MTPFKRKSRQKRKAIPHDEQPGSENPNLYQPKQQLSLPKPSFARPRLTTVLRLGCEDEFVMCPPMRICSNFMSQHNLDSINSIFGEQLPARPCVFWRLLFGNSTMQEFVERYLQLGQRWYDLPHRRPGEAVVPAVVGESELCRRVLLFYYRVSEDLPDEPPADCLSKQEDKHIALLKECLLDLPKLLEICAIYGRHHSEWTSSLVNNVVSAQQKINAVSARQKLLYDINNVVFQFYNFVQTRHDCCLSSLEVLASAGEKPTAYVRFHTKFLEVLDFVNDALFTLSAFIDAYEASIFLFFYPVETRYGRADLLKVMAILHDILLPSLLQAYKSIPRSVVRNVGKLDGILVSDIKHVIRLLAKRTVDFGWRLLETYLNYQITEGDVRATSNFFPEVEKRAARGTIRECSLVQKLYDVCVEAADKCRERSIGRTFIQALENDFGLSNRVFALWRKGSILLLRSDIDFFLQLAGQPARTYNRESDLPWSSQALRRWERILTYNRGCDLPESCDMLKGWREIMRKLQLTIENLRNEEPVPTGGETKEEEEQNELTSNSNPNPGQYAGQCDCQSHSIRQPKQHNVFKSATALPRLTTRVRYAGSRSGSGVRGGGDEYARYVPLRDDAVPSLEEALHWLPDHPDNIFWREVMKNSLLLEFVDSYLQFSCRPYDFPPSAPGESFINNESGLQELVFGYIYWMGLGMVKRDYVDDEKSDLDLLQENLFDVPNLLDICGIYGRYDSEKIGALVTNTISAYPKLLDGISGVVLQFLSIAHDMQDRCMSALEVLTFPAGLSDNAHGKLQRQFLEVIVFINDAISAFDAFIDSYKAAAFWFCQFEMSRGHDELLNALARLYDLFLPSLLLGFQVVSSAETFNQITDNMDTLRGRVLNFGWRLLDFCYLEHEKIEGDVQALPKVFQERVEKPAVWTKMLYGTLRGISSEAPTNPYRVTFLQTLEERFGLSRRIQNLEKHGCTHNMVGSYLAMLPKPDIP